MSSLVEQAASAPVEAEKKKRLAAEAECKRLRGIIDDQLQQIEDARSAKRFSIPAGRKGKPGKLFTRVIIPDTHGQSADPEAIAALLRDIEGLQPAEVVWMGDHLDCGGFLAQHHTLGFVAQAEYTFEDDVSAANTLLDAVQKLVPNAKHYYCEGNHESRVTKWIVTQTLRNRADSAFLCRLVSPESVLSLEKRGIEYIRRDRCYGGLRTQGTLKLGPCLFNHGTSAAQHAAAQHLRKFKTNIVFAHTHRAESKILDTVHGETIGAWGFGCLCARQPLYLHSNPSEWTHGYGLQIVESKTLRFQTLHVPIVDGRSLLLALRG